MRPQLPPPANAPRRLLTAFFLGLLLAGCGGQPSAIPSESTARPSPQPAPGTGSSPSTNSVPKSVFVADLPTGRDPFFPSHRRGPAKPVTEDKAAASSPAQLARQLRLRGLWQGTTQALALINKTTFAPGEEAEVAVSAPSAQNMAPVQKIKIRCLEIRQDSVLIRVAGVPDPIELHRQSGRNAVPE